jgi:hypothetical protein
MDLAVIEARAARSRAYTEVLAEEVHGQSPQRDCLASPVPPVPLPLSVREHYGTDVPWMINRIRDLESEVSALRIFASTRPEDRP